MDRACILRITRPLCAFTVISEMPSSEPTCRLVSSSYCSIRSTHLARDAPGSNGSAKYCVSLEVRRELAVDSLEQMLYALDSRCYDTFVSRRLNTPSRSSRYAFTNSSVPKPRLRPLGFGMTHAAAPAKGAGCLPQGTCACAVIAQ